MNQRTLSRFFIVFFLGGCATTPPKTDNYQARDLLEEVCATGRNIKSAQGTVWMKASSKEREGQFPAMVKASAPATLDMEVTNLVGGTEARIQVRGNRYLIQVPGKARETRSGEDQWSGIPLKWATDLMLGRFPCPDLTSETMEVEITKSRMLLVWDERENWIYSFRQWGGRAWPEGLDYSSTETGRVVFKFEEPEKRTYSPRKWRVKSRSGQVKLRWKRRKIK